MAEDVSRILKVELKLNEGFGVVNLQRSVFCGKRQEFGSSGVSPCLAFARLLLRHTVKKIQNMLFKLKYSKICINTTIELRSVLSFTC